jgi:hypothetical protein
VSIAGIGEFRTCGLRVSARRQQQRDQTQRWFCSHTGVVGSPTPEIMMRHNGLPTLGWSKQYRGS